MADNVVANAGSGGATFRTDEDTVGGGHVPYQKLMFGPDNTFTIVSTSNPLPVDLRTDNLSGNLDINLAASAATVTVAGTGTLAGEGTGAQPELQQSHRRLHAGRGQTPVIEARGGA